MHRLVLKTGPEQGGGRKDRQISNISIAKKEAIAVYIQPCSTDLTWRHTGACGVRNGFFSVVQQEVDLTGFKKGS